MKNSIKIDGVPPTECPEDSASCASSRAACKAKVGSAWKGSLMREVIELKQQTEEGKRAVSRPMTPFSPVEAPRDLCTDNKALNGRHCRRCGKPLSGRQKQFCGFGPGSCHTLYHSEARKMGSKRMIPENHRRDLLLFGKHTTEVDRLGALIWAAKRIMTDVGSI